MLDRGRIAVTISAVVPAFNEERAIGTTIDSLSRALDDLVDDYEIIVVDDGSTDGTRAVVQVMASRQPRVRLLRHGENRGYGAALATGFAAATRSHVFLIDGDGQFDARELDRFLPVLDRADLVVGYRWPRVDPWIRRVYGWGWNRLIRALFGKIASDVDCAFKLLRRDALPILDLRCQGPTFSAELLIAARKAGFRIEELRVTHYPRRAGKAKGGYPSTILRGLYEITRLRLRTFERRKPPAPGRVAASRETRLP